jgi:hypothetical protein
MIIGGRSSAANADEYKEENNKEEGANNHRPEKGVSPFYCVGDT